MRETHDPYAVGQRIALVSIVTNAVLSASKIVIGAWGGSISAVADGIENAGDVLTSGVVWLAMFVAARPADEDHPYGHGRIENVAGLFVGAVLCATGLLLGCHSLADIGGAHEPPAAYTLAPLLVSAVVKGALAAFKFRTARRLGSSSLAADAWHETVDILSAAVATAAVGLTLLAPSRFLGADHVGGLLIGGIVLLIGLWTVKEAMLELMDTRPDEDLMRRVRDAAMSVAGVELVENQRGRKSGLRYQFDLHVEVDGDMTVDASHLLAHNVKDAVTAQVPEVADVLVHIEPAGHAERMRRRREA